MRRHFTSFKTSAAAAASVNFGYGSPRATAPFASVSA